MCHLLESIGSHLCLDQVNHGSDSTPQGPQNAMRTLRTGEYWEGGKCSLVCDFAASLQALPLLECLKRYFQMNGIFEELKVTTRLREFA
jgi:hypothetical protein